MTPAWCILEGDQQSGEVTTVADTITPPGKGVIVTCPDCKGIAGNRCHECHGQGRYVMRACPLCGDPGWDYINGTDDRDGMACHISCDNRWTADHPGWRAQVLPDKPL
jgi:predicted RNA-binding Zn-ribbon protein involved in translation (DUF1610 family)